MAQGIGGTTTLTRLWFFFAVKEAALCPAICCLLLSVSHSVLLRSAAHTKQHMVPAKNEASLRYWRSIVEGNAGVAIWTMANVHYSRQKTWPRQTVQHHIGGVFPLP